MNFVLKLEYIDPTTGLPEEPSAFVVVLIIVGALMFAKQLPKLIEEIFGIKLDGAFTMNPFKKFEDSALGGKAITGLAAGATAGAMTRGFPGMLAGGWQGMRNNKGLAGFADIRDAQANKRRALRIANDNGSTPAGRFGMRVNQALGRDNEIDRIKRDENILDNRIKEINERQAAGRDQIAANNAVASAYKKVEDRAVDQIKEGNAGQFSIDYNSQLEHISQLKTQRDYAINSAESKIAEIKSGNAGQLSQMYAGQMSYIASLTDPDDIKLEQQKLDNWLNKESGFDSVASLSSAIAQEESSMTSWLENARDKYIDENVHAMATGGKYDKTMGGMLELTYEQARVNGYSQEINASTSAAVIHGEVGKLKGENNKIEKGFIASDKEKAEYESQKKSLAEQKRVAQADLDAIKK